MGTIVVGYDGSAGAELALRWAVDEARRDSSASVVVLAAWSYPMVAASPWMAGYDVPLDLSEPTQQQAQEIIDKVVADGFPADRISARVVCGPAARSLIEAGADADMLVVGSRGHGGFAGLLLGSVSHQVAAHAPCPVVVVPSRHD